MENLALYIIERGEVGLYQSHQEKNDQEIHIHTLKVFIIFYF